MPLLSTLFQNMSDLEVQPGCFSHFFSRKTRPKKQSSRPQIKSPLDDKSLPEVEKGSIAADKRPTDSKTPEKTVSTLYRTIFSAG